MTSPNHDEITLTLNENQFITVPSHTELLDILKAHHPAPREICLAKINNRVCNLHEQVHTDGALEWLPLMSKEYRRANQQTICMLLIKALDEIDPDKKLFIQHSLADGLYCELIDEDMSRELLSKLDQKMRTLIKENDSIRPIHLSISDAVTYLQKHEPYLNCQTNLLETLPFTTFECQKETYHLGYTLLHATGLVSDFELKYWPPGFVLNVMDKIENNKNIHPVKPKKIFQVFQEYREWEQILGIHKIGDVNNAIETGEIHDLVKIAEGLHEKKIAGIADHIAQNRERLRIVFIAGPSSSGKTTFTKRLNIQCRVNGLRPVMISLDDYFVDRSRTPHDEEGKLDFESIYALDIDRFNTDLKHLMDGKHVQLPRFDFLAGQSIKGEMTSIDKDQPILIEGLHGLNEMLSETIPLKNKMKIYVSALTQLNITDHLRIPTSDIRLMRRLIRDYQFRGYTAEHTLQTWHSVRHGEEKNIFPFQEESDVIFNSALTYELPVLLHLVRPLLEAIPQQHVIFPEARRLLDLYFCIYSLKQDIVPHNSILREFIGESSFIY